MAFLFYFAVLLFAAASAVFGLDLMTSPLPQHQAKPAVADAAAPAKQSAPQAKKVATSSDKTEKTMPGAPTATKHAGAKSDIRTVYPPSNPALAAVVSKQNETNAGTERSSPQQTTANTQPQQIGVQHDNVTPPPDAAAARAEATGSTPPQQPIDAATAAAQQASNRCNIQACASAYRSFRASDCTYQPYEGTRRLCTKTTVASSHVAPPQEPRQVRGWRDREPGFREAERRGRAIRNAEGDYDDASIFDSLFGRHNRRVIVVPDDRYRGYYR